MGVKPRPTGRWQETGNNKKVVGGSSCRNGGKYQAMFCGNVLETGPCRRVLVPWSWRKVISIGKKANSFGEKEGKWHCVVGLLLKAMGLVVVGSKPHMQGIVHALWRPMGLVQKAMGLVWKATDLV